MRWQYLSEQHRHRIAVYIQYRKALPRPSYRFNIHESKRRHTRAKKPRKVLWRSLKSLKATTWEKPRFLTCFYYSSAQDSPFQTFKRKKTFVLTSSMLLQCVWFVNCVTLSTSIQQHPSINKCSSKEDTTAITG